METLKFFFPIFYELLHRETLPNVSDGLFCTYYASNDAFENIPAVNLETWNGGRMKSNILQTNKYTDQNIYVDFFSFLRNFLAYTHYTYFLHWSLVLERFFR